MTQTQQEPWHKRNRERHNENVRRWREANRERNAASVAAWREANRERAREYSRQWYAENKERTKPRMRKSHFKRKYGITVEQRDAMLAAQDNRCAACRSEDPGHKRGWFVDHCHVSGDIRGILCHPCNATIGNAKDDTNRLRALIDYLEK